MKKAKVFHLFTLVLMGLGLMGFTADDTEDAKAQLSRQISLIQEIEPYVERIDLARLSFLKTASQSVLNSINENGLGHMMTFRGYQNLIVSYRYSVSFLDMIRTPRTDGQITELLATNETIVAKFGFDDSPYTQITANVFSQMHKLVVQLDSQPIPAELKKKLSALRLPMGEVIAVAKQGDRPRAFELAVPLYHRIEALYPEFNEVASSNAAFNIVLEIQGLNEFYGDFAQVD